MRTDSLSKLSGSEKICFCFPGQLLEPPCLNTDLLNCGAVLQDISSKTLELTGFNFSSHGFQDQRLNQYTNLKLQLSTYIVSVLYYRLLRQHGVVPDIITEHSMGIYAALVASGVFTFEETLMIVFEIGLLLEQNLSQLDGAMASVIGLSEDQINEILHRVIPLKVFVANYNGSKNFVLSGQREGIQKAITVAVDHYHAVSASMLTLNIPLHCMMLERFQPDLSAILSKAEPRTPKIPLINHLWLESCKPKMVRELVCESIFKPVHWDLCVQKIASSGVHRFVEVGYGETLFKLVRWIDRDITVMNIRDQKSIERIAEKLKNLGHHG